MVEEIKNYPLLIEKDFLFEKDENNNFKPQTIYIDELKRSIVITPIAQEEWIEMLDNSQEGTITTTDQDIKIIEKHLIEPKLNIEELKKAGKHILISKVVQAILNFSARTVD